MRSESEGLKVLTMPKCKTPCSLTAFLSLLKPVIRKNIEIECQVDGKKAMPWKCTKFEWKLTSCQPDSPKGRLKINFKYRVRNPQKFIFARMKSSIAHFTITTYYFTITRKHPLLATIHLSEVDLIFSTCPFCIQLVSFYEGIVYLFYSWSGLLILVNKFFLCYESCKFCFFHWIVFYFIESSVCFRSLGK